MRKIAIQIGSNCGNDSFFDMVKSEKYDHVYIIEPHREFNDALVAQYSALVGTTFDIENIAIIPAGDTGTVKIYDYDDKFICSSAINRWVDAEPKFTMCPCDTISGFLDKRKITAVDLLLIDAEGLDFGIIMSIDFQKYDISRIIWEMWDAENCDTNGTYAVDYKLQHDVIHKLVLMRYKVSTNAFGIHDISNYTAEKIP